MNGSETVLITGASSGIGLELARCFSAERCRLILVARNQAALENLAHELRQKDKVQTIVLPSDLSLPEACREIFENLKAQNIAVDVLVNNAGFGLHGFFAELPLQRQMEIIRVNVAALTELTGLFLPAMIRRKRGGLLNVGSVAGFVAGPLMAVYYATKAYVQSFTEALAEELDGTEVSVTALCPGPTETNFGAVARGTSARRFQSKKMSARDVAEYGHRAFRKKQVIAVPDVQSRALVFLSRFASRRSIRRGVKRYNRLKE